MVNTTRRPCRAMAIAALLLATLSAHAQNPAVQNPAVPRVWVACKVEIEMFCDKITPGNGRIIACLYANEDQLSITCDYHLLQAAGELAALMGELNRFGVVCKSDIESLCGNVEIGKGRVVRCLRAQQKAVSAACLEVMEATGIDKK